MVPSPQLPLPPRPSRPRSARHGHSDGPFSLPVLQTCCPRSLHGATAPPAMSVRPSSESRRANITGKAPTSSAGSGGGSPLLPSPVTSGNPPAPRAHAGQVWGCVPVMASLGAQAPCPRRQCASPPHPAPRSWAVTARLPRQQPMAGSPWTQTTHVSVPRGGHCTPGPALPREAAAPRAPPHVPRFASTAVTADAFCAINARPRRSLL